MTTAKKLALIAAGYAFAILGGCAAVAVNEWRMPTDIAQGSPGMVAFGDMILFVLATGFLGLVPTAFLLKLWIDKAPRTLLAAVLVVAVLGPVSWLLMVYLAASPPEPNQPSIAWQLLGPFIAFGAIPRIVAGPVLVVAEAIAFFLVGGRATRALLAAAMLMDIIPIGLYVLRMTTFMLRHA
jgi:hypothetical protein